MMRFRRLDKRQRKLGKTENLEGRIEKREEQKKTGKENIQERILGGTGLENKFLERRNLSRDSKEELDLALRQNEDKMMI